MNANELLKLYHKQEARLEMLREDLRERYGIKKATPESIASRIKELKHEQAELRSDIKRRLDALRTSFPSAMGGVGED